MSEQTMKKSKFSASRMAFILCQAEEGARVGEVRLMSVHVTRTRTCVRSTLPPEPCEASPHSHCPGQHVTLN